MDFEDMFAFVITWTFFIVSVVHYCILGQFNMCSHLNDLFAFIITLTYSMVFVVFHRLLSGFTVLSHISTYFIVSDCI